VTLSDSCFPLFIIMGYYRAAPATFALRARAAGAPVTTFHSGGRGPNFPVPLPPLTGERSVPTGTVFFIGYASNSPRGYALRAYVPAGAGACL